MAKKGEPKGEPRRVPVLIPQPNGRGALLSGGQVGQTPGPGRPTSAIRGELRQVFARAVTTLDNVSQGRVFLRFFEKCPECGHESDSTVVPIKTATADVLRAIEIAGKFGIGEAKGYDESLVEALGAAVRDDVSDEVWERIRSRWVVVIGLHVRGA